MTKYIYKAKHIYKAKYIDTYVNMKHIYIYIYLIDRYPQSCLSIQG